MSRVSISIDVANMDDVASGMKNCQKQLAMGARRTNLDLAKRGVNTVVRNEVSKVYNIKKKDISSNSDRWYTEKGSVSLAGVNIPLLDVTYKGRMLTPIHFGMRPKAKPSARRYTIKWKPFRGGGMEVLTSNSGETPFLMRSGYGGTPNIPMARAGKKRMPINSIKRLSVPIMIENDKVSPHITEEILKRMESGMSRYMK